MNYFKNNSNVFFTFFLLKTILKFENFSNFLVIPQKNETEIWNFSNIIKNFEYFPMLKNPFNSCHFNSSIIYLFYFSHRLMGSSLQCRDKWLCCTRWLANAWRLSKRYWCEYLRCDKGRTSVQTNFETFKRAPGHHDKHSSKYCCNQKWSLLCFKVCCRSICWCFAVSKNSKISKMVRNLQSWYVNEIKPHLNHILPLNNPSSLVNLKREI